MPEIPEIIEHGVTGFVVGNEAEAVAAIHQVHTLDRAKIRANFEARFTARRMAENYLEAYESLTQTQHPRLTLVR